MAQEFAVIGKKGMIDNQTGRIVTGKLDFAADHLPGKKLFGRIKCSPHPHAKILSMDISKAQALPGVKAIANWENCDVLTDMGVEAYDTGTTLRSLMPQEITWWGQAVAIVVATEPNIAEQAIDLLEIEYEELNYVIDPDDAQKSSSPLVGCWEGSNVRENPGPVVRGDIEAGKAIADKKATLSADWSNYFQSSNIEPRVTLAWWDGDHVHVRLPTPGAFNSRSVIWGFLDNEVPLSHIHVVSHGTGMIVGDKINPYLECAAAVRLSRMLKGAPVCMNYSRREFFLNTQHQHPATATIEMGLKNDGTITYMEGAFYGQCGGEGSAWASDLKFPIVNTIKCPNVHIKTFDVATNIPWTGIYRSVQNPPGDYCMEVILDKAAELVGMTPYEFRMKNYTWPQDPQQDNGKPFSSQAVRQNLETVATAINYSNKWHEPDAKTLDDGRKHGIGIAGCVESHSAMGGSIGAIINMTKDGKALTNHGLTRVGCGTNATCNAIVAEILGLQYEDVITGDWGNTDVASDAQPQWGSMGTITNGAAWLKAAEDVRDQLFDRAAAALSVAKQNLSIGEGKVYVTGDKATYKTVRELCAQAPQLIGKGYSWAQNLQRDLHGFKKGTPAETRCTCASATEVAVDTETGEVELLKICNSIDCGRIINLDGVTKQLYAGMDSIAAQALYWEQIVDGVYGGVLNPNFLDHRWPTSLDIDRETVFEPLPIETDDAVGPLGAKGIGEPVITTYGSVVCAVYNAIGKWITPPITAAKVLKALGKA